MRDGIQSLSGVFSGSISRVLDSSIGHQKKPHVSSCGERQVRKQNAPNTYTSAFTQRGTRAALLTNSVAGLTTGSLLKPPVLLDLFAAVAAVVGCGSSSAGEDACFVVGAEENSALHDCCKHPSRTALL